MVRYHGCFAWYELLTTDVIAAKTFYAEVIGWGARNASTPDLPYMLFTAEQEPVAGLMELPAEARKMGATPRWMGYVGVDDVDSTAGLIARLGGAVYVPPTDTNIGRISVVADPQTATLALRGWRPRDPPQSADLTKPGRVGWHELLAADWRKAFDFYREIFGWQKSDAETGSTESYRLLMADGETFGGMLAKRPAEPVPFWLYYFNIDDIDAATARVKTGGGQLFEGPIEVPGGSWIARYVDPQGALFALQGQRSPDNIRRAQGSEIGWSTAWSGISSRGRLVTKPRG